MTILNKTVPNIYLKKGEKKRRTGEKGGNEKKIMQSMFYILAFEEH